MGAGDREGDSGYVDEFLQLPGLEAWLGAKKIVDRCFTCWVYLAKLIFPGSDLELGEGHMHSLSLHRNIDLMSVICGIWSSCHPWQLTAGVPFPRKFTLLPTQRCRSIISLISLGRKKSFIPIHK